MLCLTPGLNGPVNRLLLCKADTGLACSHQINIRGAVLARGSQQSTYSTQRSPTLYNEVPGEASGHRAPLPLLYTFLVTLTHITHLLLDRLLQHLGDTLSHTNDQGQVCTAPHHISDSIYILNMQENLGWFFP